MTIRNLHFMFNPSSIVLVEADQMTGTIGAALSQNLRNAKFCGELFFVSDKCRCIEGYSTYPDVQRLPKTPDMAVITAPLKSIPELIKELGMRGVRAAVVITEGFPNGSQDENRLQDQMLGAAQPYLLRILGPDSKGIMVPGVCLNASIGHIQPTRGNLAFVSQSGSVLSAVLDWAASNGIGFSYVVSVGNMIDVDFGDLLDYLAIDFNTKAILLYIESITQPRKFISAARAAARMKPVIVVKAGCYAEGARSAYHHCGRIAGADDVYDAVFQRAGMLRVKDIQALFDAVETLALSQTFSGDRLVILTNGGGVGALAADDLIERNGRLADLSPQTQIRLISVMPAVLSYNNPLDIHGDAPPERYVDAINILLEDDGVDAILIINSPSAISSCTAVARAVVDFLIKSRSKMQGRGIFTCWLGTDAAREARKISTENKIPTYETPTEAVRGFMQIVRYRRSQEMLMQTPPNIPEYFEPEVGKVQKIIDGALSEGRSWLAESEITAVLTAYKFPVNNVNESNSYDKDDEINAVLNMEEVQKKTGRKWTFANELFIGVREDVQFGPVIVFGQGSMADEEGMLDRAMALPPLNMHLAREVMNRTRICRWIESSGERPAADMNGIAVTLVRVSQMICDLADIVELEINPLIVGEQKVTAQNVRIRVRKSHCSAMQHLVICPYPKEYEKSLVLPDGQQFLIRPVRPEDEPAFQTLFTTLTQEEIRLRFFHAMRYLSHNMAARLTQIDYDREMALVLCDPAGHKDKTLYGMVRITADPDNERAEFDILIHHDMTGLGLGPMLLRRIIDCARQRGIREIFGEVLAENDPMLKLCNAFGFKKRSDPDDPGVMIVTLTL
jgi:acetyltransferase